MRPPRVTITRPEREKLEAFSAPRKQSAGPWRMLAKQVSLAPTGAMTRATSMAIRDVKAIDGRHRIVAKRCHLRHASPMAAIAAITSHEGAQNGLCRSDAIPMRARWLVL